MSLSLRLGLGPQEVNLVKAKAYTTFVRPKLEYSSPVWDPNHKLQINQMEKSKAGLPFLYFIITQENPELLVCCQHSSAVYSMALYGTYCIFYMGTGQNGDNFSQNSDMLSQNGDINWSKRRYYLVKTAANQKGGKIKY